MSKIIAWVAVCWLAFLVIPSHPTVRLWLAAPLFAWEKTSTGDACYVLAGGVALWERLAAAADLYQTQRVRRIYLMKSSMILPYNLKVNASWTQTEWALDYLAWRGVPGNAITLIEEKNGMFGTLTEAKNVSKHLSQDVKSLVVVSSPAHMRRSVLAFKRSLPPDVKVVPYAAISYEASVELYSPIWIEYLKLLVYCLVA